MSTNGAERDLHDQLLAAAAKRSSDNLELEHFQMHAINSIAQEDLALYSPEAWTQILADSFENFGKRGQKPFFIALRDSKDDNDKPIQIIDIFTQDMPFVVDSILAAVRAEGAQVRAFIHPVLPSQEQGGEPQVQKAATSSTRNESFLQVHIDSFAQGAPRDALMAELEDVLMHVRNAVRGWRPMLEKLKNLVSGYRQNPPDVPSASLAEGLHFLAWLADHNFTFLGMREYKLIGRGADARLEPKENSGLGILESSDVRFLRDGTEYVEMTEQHVAFLQTSRPIMVTKANIRSKVHRRTHLDYIGVKLYGADGQLSGELRILGMFTSMSLTTSHSDVPIIRRKVAEIMRRSGLETGSHDGKALMAALDNYPRDELFQIGENDLYEFSTAIAALADRPQVRALPRIDRFDNYVSILLFIPRDRYDSELREKIGEYLADIYDGRVSAYYPNFPEGELVRVHFIIGRNGGMSPRPRRVDIEKAITKLTRSFADRMAAISKDTTDIAAYADAFTGFYQSSHTEQHAIADLQVCKELQELHESETVSVRLFEDGGPGLFLLKFYHAGSPVPLSSRVPLLENFGFKVVDEDSFTVSPKNLSPIFLNEMHVSLDKDTKLDVSEVGPKLERAIKAIWANQAESDSFNKLSLAGGLEWDKVVLVRAFARYLRQMGVSFSQDYIALVLETNVAITIDLIDLFETLHDPDYASDRKIRAKSLHTQIAAALETIVSLDEDRIIRHILNLIDSALRTNFYQRGDDGARREALAIKYDANNIDGLPRPKPYREIHVYAPRVEGIHLRGGAIARGGLRWSDRPEDFRTEILGLVKAQMTKNAVIVPLGAKGGFVPKQMPVAADRDAFIAEGTACYKIFIGTLLDITDNLDGDTIIEPKQLVRRDGDDPYLVVAADKGTATFSDTANAISQSRNFWLDDAFASGGSAGYDHKKMGITARGAWESVKRHFRELNRDIQTEPFTTVGVGDMSGDVFGNGMLLSEQTRLIAAFDHRDIFIDPDPDPAVSFAERKRVFNLGRSSWRDYNESHISKGGGIFSRSAKSITLTTEIKTALGITADTATPQQLMTAILCSRVDLMWFGGIGTYIRATSESDAEAGDRANDSIRVTGTQVNAKVVGEGANLGLTQLGRIEFAQKGGRVNTDAIDNSAGVNSSDLEVNIKIALGTVVRDGGLTIDNRNDFLEEMTEEVAALCLRNNYLQSLTISLVEREGAEGAAALMDLMQVLESGGHLDRPVEFLPDDQTIIDRMASGQGLTRPEMSVILAYAKNTLYTDLLASNVPDDACLGKELYRYFPKRLAEKYPDTISNHRLRREVIATVLANAMINRGGPSYISTLSAATSADAGQIAFAYTAARDAFGLTELNASIDSRDTEVTGDVQLALYREVQLLLVNQSLWFLRNVSFEAGLDTVIKTYADGVEEIRQNLTDLLPPFITRSIADQAAGFENGGTPKPLARRISELSALSLSSDIIHLSQTSKVPVLDSARAYFAILEQFKLGRITELSGSIHVTDRYDRMALDRALANLMRAQRDITEDVLAAGEGSIADRHKQWNKNLKAEIDRMQKMVTDLTEGDLTVSRLSVAAGLLSDLARY